MGEDKYPEPCVGVLIRNADDRFLLLRSHKWNNHYCVPGGHIDLGETMVETVKREVWEETGIKDVKDIEFVCIQDFIFDEAFHKKKHFVFIDYSCRIDATTAEADIKLNEEAEEHVWATMEEALKLPVHKYTKKLLEEYRKKHKI